MKYSSKRKLVKFRRSLDYALVLILIYATIISFVLPILIALDIF